MNFSPTKTPRLSTTLFFLSLMTVTYYGFNQMTSPYKTDQGNGIVIYADDYVASGKWVFYCNTSRLISREPLPAPLAELKENGKLTTGTMYALSHADEMQAIEAIKEITKIEGWYTTLRYRYSALDESSNLTVHDFDLFARHDGRLWALTVSQWLHRNRSSFKITAEPYDPEHYMDHAKMLKVAAASCPTPQ